MLLTGCFGVDEHQACSVPVPDKLPLAYSVTPFKDEAFVSVRVPQRSITLIRRKNGRVLAVQFSNVRSEKGEEERSGCAHYQVADVTGKKPKPLCSGEASDFIMRHDGPSFTQIVLKRIGKQEIPCVPAARYGYPGTLSIDSWDDVAVTKWTTFEAVDARHPALRWFNAGTNIGEELGIELTPEQLPR